MKVKLQIEIDLPDNTPEEQQADLRQLLYDSYVNHAAVSHLSDAVEWAAKCKLGSESEDALAKRIYLFHKEWGQICSNATWSFTTESSGKKDGSE